MLFRKLKVGTGIGAMVTGAHRLVGARPVKHGCGSYFGSVKEKFNRFMGSRGLAPLGCLPRWGRERVTLAISSSSQKTRREFLQSRIFANTGSGNIGGNVQSRSLTYR